MNFANKQTPFTIYLNEQGYLVAPCDECAGVFSVIDDEMEFDRDSGGIFCDACFEKLQREAEEDLAYKHAEYQRMVGF